MRFLLDEQGRLFGKWNLIDTLVGVTLVLVAAGVVAVQSGWHRTSGQMVSGETDLELTVQLFNVRMQRTDMFEPGKPVALTVRNRPRGNVTLLASQVERRKALAPKGGGYELVDDPTMSSAYDVTLRLKDHALVTPDGYVSSGVKIKIGMPIDIEGFDYRMSGFMTDIRPLPADAAKSAAQPPAHP